MSVIAVGATVVAGGAITAGTIGAGAGLLGAGMTAYSGYKGAKRSAQSADNATNASLAMHQDNMDFNQDMLREAKNDYRQRLGEYQRLRDDVMKRLTDAQNRQDDFAIRQLNQQLDSIEDNYSEVLGQIQDAELAENQMISQGDGAVADAIDRTNATNDSALQRYDDTINQNLTESDREIGAQLDERDRTFQDQMDGSQGRFNDILDRNEKLDGASLEEGRGNVDQLTGNRALTQGAYGDEVRQQMDRVEGLTMGDRPDGLDASESRIESGYRDAEAQFRRQNGGRLSEGAQLALSMGKARNLGENSADAYENWAREKRGFTMNQAGQMTDMAGRLRDTENENAERDFSANEGLRMEDKADRSRYADARLQRDERDLERNVTQGNQMMDRRIDQDRQSLDRRNQHEGNVMSETIRGNESAYARDMEDARYREGRDLTRSQTYLDRTVNAINKRDQADMASNTDYINSLAGNQALTDQANIDALQQEQASRDMARASMADARNVAMGGNATATGNMASIYGDIARTNIQQAGEHGRSVGDAFSMVGDMAGKVDWGKMFGKQNTPSPVNTPTVNNATGWKPNFSLSSSDAWKKF